jgi:transposase
MLQDTDFVQLARREPSARKRIRLLALAHFKEGKNRAAIARILKVSRASVNKWVADFLRNGLEGLKDSFSPGRPPSLSQSQLQQLVDFVETRSFSEQGGRLTGANINLYIHTEFGVNDEPSLA